MSDVDEIVKTRSLEITLFGVQATAFMDCTVEKYLKKSNKKKDKARSKA